MAIVRKRIILRNKSRSDEKEPRRIRFDGLAADDSLLVEIVTNRENDLSYCYLFQPEHRGDRKSAAYRVCDNRVTWEGDVQPRPLLQIEANELCPLPSSTKRKPAVRRPKGRKILIFDEKGYLVSIYFSLQDAASMMNLREAAIDKLCKSKRPSFETGYYFRYWWRVLDFDITDFSMTAMEYDLLCGRKRKFQVVL